MSRNETSHEFIAITDTRDYSFVNCLNVEFSYCRNDDQTELQYLQLNTITLIYKV